MNPLSIERNEIIADTYIKNINQIYPTGNQKSRISEYNLRKSELIQPIIHPIPKSKAIN